MGAPLSYVFTLVVRVDHRELPDLWKGSCAYFLTPPVCLHAPLDVNQTRFMNGIEFDLGCQLGAWGLSGFFGPWQ